MSRLPLHIAEAAGEGEMSTILAWLDEGGEINAPYDFPDGRATGFTLLMEASGNGHPDLVEALLSRRADVHTQDSNGLNALMVAASYGYDECIRRLLAAGAAVICRDNNGRSALQRADYWGNKRCVEAMSAHIESLQQGAARLRDLQSVVDCACEGDAAAVVAWLDAGGDADFPIDSTDGAVSTRVYLASLAHTSQSTHGADRHLCLLANISTAGCARMSMCCLAGARYDYAHGDECARPCGGRRGAACARSERQPARASHRLHAADGGKRTRARAYREEVVAGGRARGREYAPARRHRTHLGRAQWARGVRGRHP